MLAPIEIRVELLRRGVSCRSLAKEIGVHQANVSKVLHRIRGTVYIRKAIARAIGESYETVWGESEAEKVA